MDAEVVAAWMQLLVAVPMAGALAVGVWRVGRHHQGAKALIALLVLEGGAHVFWAAGELVQGSFAHSSAAVAVALFALSAVTYMFVLRVLGTRWTRPLEKAWVVLTVAALCLLPAMVALVQGQRSGAYPQFRDNILLPEARFLLGSLVATTLLSMYALGASLLAWRGAPRGTPRRMRAAGFALAFGARDSVFTVAVMGTIALSTFGPEYQDLAMPLWPMASILYMPLVVFAILRLQVLNMEVHAKVTIRGGFVAAAVAGAMLVGSEILEGAFNVTQWYAAVAIGVAAALAAKPLGMLGARIADRLLPGVENTPAYRTVRACELYRSACEDAMRDGNVTKRERALLDRLAANLELEPDAIARIETSVSAS